MTLEPVTSRFYLGLDLGQAKDYSAIAIVERRVELTGERDPITYLDRTVTRILVTHLERIPLRTSYPEVVERVRSLTQPYPKRKIEIVMDATGVGGAVKDMLTWAKLGCTVYGVIITGGERVSLVHGGYHVPRHDLLANLRVLLEKRMLEIEVPRDIGSLLEAEFLRWGRRAAHNDLIFATALASWKAAGQPISLYGPALLPLYEDKWGKL
jgi:hypothetical protein